MNIYSHRWDTGDMEASEILKHGIPIASYRKAIWPEHNSPDSLLPCFWNGKTTQVTYAQMRMLYIVYKLYLR